MPAASLIWIAWALAGMLLAGLLPSSRRIDVMAIGGFAFLGIVAPWSCLALVVGVLIGAWQIRRSGARRSNWRLALVVTYAALVLALHGVRASAEDDGTKQFALLLGAAYFSCRLVHVAFESFAGRLPALSLADQLRFHFFLPTILVGPIHRIANFTRETRRRRDDPAAFYAGLERALFGAAKVAVLANLFLEGQCFPWLRLHGPEGFAGAWLLGALGWIWLYLSFSGYSDLAIGFANACGISIEENFDRPWAARNLIDFWQRWHITLSGWCRDYIYAPLAAATRRHGVALLAAMLVMGAWHELSAYYMLWGVYHATGIVLCRLLQRAPWVAAGAQRQSLWLSAAARLATFAWLAGSAPVVSLVLDVIRSRIA